MVLLFLQRLTDDSIDFLKASTLKTVQQAINNILKSLSRDSKNMSKLKDLKKSCRGFFMSILCDLTFRREVAPEPAVIKMLLDSVFNAEDESSTQELAPYKESRVDKIPTIRLFLPQLLLEHR